ncbi:hypothetical protein E4U41_003559, partial [Claviceps citrina]
MAGRLSMLLLAAASVLVSPAPGAAGAVVTGPHAELSNRHAPEAPAIPETHLRQRATDQSPRGYAPSRVDCPRSRPRVRDGYFLSTQEQQWLPRRRNETIAPMRALLRRLAIPGFDVDKYLAGVESDATALPNIGLAV